MPLLISSTSLYCLELTSYPLEEKGIKGSHEVALTIKSSNRIDLSLRRESRDVTSAEREKEVVKEEERRGGEGRERERASKILRRAGSGMNDLSLAWQISTCRKIFERKVRRWNS